MATLEPIVIEPITEEMEISTTIAVPRRCCVCFITHGIQECDSDTCDNFICEEHERRERATCFLEFRWCPDCARQRAKEHPVPDVGSTPSTATYYLA